MLNNGESVKYKTPFRISGYEYKVQAIESVLSGS